MTKRLVALIGAQSLRRVFASIGEETGVDEKRNIFHDYVRELEASTSFATPRWLGIDEIRVCSARGAC